MTHSVSMHSCHPDLILLEGASYIPVQIYASTNRVIGEDVHLHYNLSLVCGMQQAPLGFSLTLLLERPTYTSSLPIQRLQGTISQVSMRIASGSSCNPVWFQYISSRDRLFGWRVNKIRKHVIEKRSHGIYQFDCHNMLTPVIVGSISIILHDTSLKRQEQVSSNPSCYEL